MLSISAGVGEEFLLSHMLSVYSTDGFLCFLILHNPICQFLGPFHVLLAVQKVNSYDNMSECGITEVRKSGAQLQKIMFEM